MNNADQEITLFNFYGSPEDPDILLSKRTVFTGVSVFAQIKVNVVKEGLVSANLYTIRIPKVAANATYYRPANFEKLAEKGTAFTLKEGDLIVLGYADDENPKLDTLKRKYGDDSVVTITAATDNRGKQGPHWKVIGQ